MADQKELAGALFRVAVPKSEKHPSFTGTCVIGGRRYRISGWSRTIQQGERAGERYLGLAFTLADEQPGRQPGAAQPPDDGTPF